MAIQQKDKRERGPQEWDEGEPLRKKKKKKRAPDAEPAAAKAPPEPREEEREDRGDDGESAEDKADDKEDALVALGGEGATLDQERPAGVEAAAAREGEEEDEPAAAQLG